MGLRINSAVLLAPMLLLAAPASAWGPTGHRAAAQVAENHLTPKAARAVRELLGGETLAMVSTWADDARSTDEWRHTGPWHYVNIPDGETYESSPKNPDGDVLSAMQAMEATLRKPDASRDDRLHALKFLVHFVADIHQPLHAGLAGDRGGNQVEVRWIGAPEPINLHSLWDSALIGADKLSYTELAAWIDRAPDAEMQQWRRAGYLDYARESMELRAACYELESGNRAGYGYLNRHLPTVYRRLAQAGVRLAGLLNSIFAPDPE